MATKSPLETMQDQALAAVHQSQQAVLDAFDAWSSSLSGLVPDKFTMPAMPFMDGLPKPSEAVDSAFAFAQSVLASQQDFTRKLLAYAEPAVVAPVTKTAKTA